MISVYIETSAVIDGLSDEDPLAAEALSATNHLFFTSSLTLVEIERKLVRAAHESPAREAMVRNRLNKLLPRVQILALEPGVLARAKQRFHVEPVRALDALHLATILVLLEDLKWCAVLSNDKRVRDNVTAYGLMLLPSGGA